MNGARDFKQYRSVLINIADHCCVVLVANCNGRSERTSCYGCLQCSNRSNIAAMPLPLTADEVQNLFGSLNAVLNNCPASQMPVIAGDAGWDVGMIPDGMDESGSGVRRNPIRSAIVGQWNSWDPDLKALRVRTLAKALCEFLVGRGEADRVNTTILKHGYRFQNGDFVPADAHGNIPS